MYTFLLQKWHIVFNTLLCDLWEEAIMIITYHPKIDADGDDDG